MVANILRSGVYKADKVIHDILVIICQEKRRSPKWLTLYRLPLLMTYRTLDDADNKFRSFVVELICRIIEIPEKALYLQLLIFAGFLHP